MTSLAFNMTDIKQQTIRQKTLVFGLGLTGYSCVCHLVNQGYDVVVFDTREAPPYLEKVYCEYPQVEVYLGEPNTTFLDDVNQVVVSPGVSLSFPLLVSAKQKGIEIVGDIQLFSNQAKAPIIAITGSNGKTTTTSLVAEMFRAAGKSVNVGGNIGIPVLNLLEEPTPDFYLLELSSFQLETTSHLKAEVSVVLNISEDHMDRYANVDEYANSKLAVYSQAYHQIVNLDDAWLTTHVKTTEKTIGFTQHRPAKNQYGLITESGEQWLAYGDERICKASDVKLKGRHQLSNALVALAIGDLCELSRGVMSQVLKEFGGLAHRTQTVATIDGVTYINDSKGTNIGATLAAITGIDAPIVLIAGGESKGADFSDFGHAIVEHVKHVILMGNDADIIESGIHGLIPTTKTASLNEAVRLAADLSIDGDCVLLSPACASFDMFENYQHRGDAFISEVKALSAIKTSEIETAETKTSETKASVSKS